MSESPQTRIPPRAHDERVVDERMADSIARLKVAPRYRTIVADPPWDVSNGMGSHAGRRGTGVNHATGSVSSLGYPVMSVSEIRAFPVGDLAERDAHLYLWTTQGFLRDAYDVAAAWGFTPSCALVWCKPPRGWTVGGTYMSTVEFCLFCRRGSLPALRRVESQWFEWRRGSHSAKPEAFLDMVESVSPAPRVELWLGHLGRSSPQPFGDASVKTLREHLEEILKYDAAWASPDANNCAREARSALAILDPPCMTHGEGKERMVLVPDP